MHLSVIQLGEKIKVLKEKSCFGLFSEDGQIG